VYRGWKMDLRRYRLQQFAPDEIAALVRRGTDTLRDLADGGPVSAFRAGGWCLQPFDRLRQPLLDAGVCIDSTVYAGGVQRGSAQAYDFRAAPRLSRWRFDADPLRPDPNGPFLEVPIASHAVNPLLYWRLALLRKSGAEQHRTMGGEAMRPSRADLARKLLLPSASVVSFDGIKAELLEPALAEHRRRGLDDFVILGHPKALTPHGLDQLEAFVERHRRRERFVGLDHYAAELRQARTVASRGAAPRAPQPPQPLSPLAAALAP
jgi:hypothetical protein